MWDRLVVLDDGDAGPRSSGSGRPAACEPPRRAKDKQRDRSPVIDEHSIMARVVSSEKQLLEARTQLWFLGMLVGGGLFLTGISLWILEEVYDLIPNWLKPLKLIWCLGFSITPLGATPADERSVRCLHLSVVFLSTILLICAICTSETGTSCAFGVITVCNSLYAFGMPTRQCYRYLWASFRTSGTLMSIVHLALGKEHLVSITNLILAAALTPRTRQWIQTRFFKPPGSSDGASPFSSGGAAALLGSREAQQVIADTKGQLRAIAFSELREEHLGSRELAKSLFVRSKPVALGACDAFVSHAWNEDAHAKYVALAGWAARFEADHGHEPLLWFDGACLCEEERQPAPSSGGSFAISNAGSGASRDASGGSFKKMMRSMSFTLHDRSAASPMANLPVYLASCKELVVLSGSTYSSRLWCLIELYTWVSLGCSIDRISVLPLEDTLPTHASLGLSNQAVAIGEAMSIGEAAAAPFTIEASAAKCSDEAERQRLLGVVETMSDCARKNEPLTPLAKSIRLRGGARTPLPAHPSRAPCRLRAPHSLKRLPTVT